MSPTRNSMLAGAEVARQRARARADQGRRQVDRDDVARRGARPRSPARRCRSRRRAGARRAGPPAARTSSVARISSRPARTVARMRLTGASEVSRAPGIDRGAVEVGLELAAAGDVGDVSASVEPQQIEDVTVLHRRRVAAARCPPSSVAARRRYSFCTASSSGDGSISNSVDFFRRLRRITSRSGKCASVFRPTRSL